MCAPPEYVVIGHVTHDRQPDGGVLLGGTALYAGLTALRLGRRVAVATAGRLTGLAEAMPGADLLQQGADNATTFVNRYRNGGRTQHLLAAAPPVDVAALPDAWRAAPIIHLGPVAREIDPAALGGLSPAWLCATPQGWLRSWDAAGLVTLRPADAAAFAEVPLRVLVLSEGAEHTNAAALLDQVLARGGMAVVTHGERGSTLYQGDGNRHVPTYPVGEVDPTGAGDVYAAALFVRLAAGDAPLDAAAYASAAAALSVTGPGVAAIPDNAAIRRLMAGA